MSLSNAQADVALSRLSAIRKEVAAHITNQWYAPFSGMPQSGLGALAIAYNDGIRSLNNTREDVVNGFRSTANWLALVDTVERSMRSISGYSDGTSARSEVEAVASDTGTKLLSLVTRGASVLSAGIWAGTKAAFIGAPVIMSALLLMILALLYLTFAPVFSAFKGRK